MGAREDASGGRRRAGGPAAAACAAAVRAVRALVSTVPLLLLVGTASADLDSRQHNGHAAELAIEMMEVPSPLPVKQGCAVAAAAEAAGEALVERLNSKLSQALVGGRCTVWEGG